MVEFPPNLDDGELWLPSDVIREVGSLHPPPIRHVVTTPPIFELIARQIAALRLVDQFSEPAANRTGCDFVKPGGWTGPAVQKSRSGGTGVFLPRVWNVEYESHWKVAGMKPDMVRVGGPEQQVQQNTVKLKDAMNGGVVVTKSCQQQQERKIAAFQGPMALPADWTY